MIVVEPDGASFSDAWIEGEDGARWRSAAGHSPSTGARASGSSLIQVPAGCRLPRHTDSLSFVAVYAAPDVVTRYEHVVQPDGTRERHTVS